VEKAIELNWWDFLTEEIPRINANNRHGDHERAKLETLLKDKDFSEEITVQYIEQMFLSLSFKHKLDELDELVLTLLMHRPNTLLLDHHLKQKPVSIFSSLAEDEDGLVQREKMTFGRNSKREKYLNKYCFYIFLFFLGISSLILPLEDLEISILLALMKSRIMIGFSVDNTCLEKSEKSGYLHGEELKRFLRKYTDMFFMDLLKKIKGLESF
jgi:hypothetical protein